MYKLPCDTVVEAWDNDVEAMEDEDAEEEVWATNDPAIVVPPNTAWLGEDTKAPDETGCEFLSNIATGEGDPELLLIEDE